jgi:hypothetical protein
VIVLLFIICLLLIMLAGCVWALVRSSKRLLEFDDLFELLAHDVNTNIDYFESISEHPVLGNAEEIVVADRNMRIMRARLEEYVSQMEELTRRQLRKKKVVPNPPVVA